MSSTELEKSALPAIGPRIGLWGRFDVESFGDLLVPRVFEHEMRRRLAGAAVQPYAPLGPRHPIALDGGLTARALGAWSRFRAAELARELDCVVIGGGNVIHTQDALFAGDYGLSSEEVRRLRLSSFFVEGLGPSLEKTCPVAWNAVGVPFAFHGEEASRIRAALSAGRYLSVRDAASRKRLLDAGVAARIEVVPDPTLLVARVYPSDLLGRRLEYLRFMDWFPSSGQPIVLQGGRSLVPRARSIARALLRSLQKRTVPIVLVETEVGSGESDFFDALSPHLSGALFRLPGSAALSDIAAVLAHASVFVGTSFAAGLAAHSFGVPVARLSLLGGRKPVPWPPTLQRQAGALVSRPEDLSGVIARLLAASRPEGLPRDVERRLDRHFDVLAEIAESAADRRPSRRRRSGRRPVADALRDAERRIESWQLAYEARGEQLLHQRIRLSEALEKLEGEVAASASELSAAHARKIALEAELARSEEAGRGAREALEQSHEREVEAQRTMHRLEKDLSATLAQKAHAEEDLASARSSIEKLASDLSSRAAELALERAERTRAQEAVTRFHERIAAVEGEKEQLVGELTSERASRAAEEREAAARLSESVGEQRQAEKKSAQAETAAAILDSEVQRLKAALERIARSEARLRISRAALLDQLEGGRAAVARGTSGPPAEIERLRAELARVHAELSQLSNLKILRYSAPLRAVYGRVLALRGRDRKNDP